MKNIKGYVEAIHKRVFKASARSKKVMCMINDEHHKNGKDIPAGSEDIDSQLEVLADVFSNDV